MCRKYTPPMILTLAQVEKMKKEGKSLNDLFNAPYIVYEQQPPVRISYTPPCDCAKVHADYKRRQREYYLGIIDRAILYTVAIDIAAEAGLVKLAKGCRERAVERTARAKHYARHFHVLG